MEMPLTTSRHCGTVVIGGWWAEVETTWCHGRLSEREQKTHMQ